LQIYLLREPFLIIAGFLVLFLTVIIYVRLDFSISSSKSAKASGGNSALIENVIRRQGKRAQVYENFDNQLAKLKTNKDAGAFQSALKNLQVDHKNETQAINDIVTKLRAETPELCEV
jgi:oligosaccharyltransferase complex subunit alpha (ribophorin I)